MLFTLKAYQLQNLAQTAYSIIQSKVVMDSELNI